MTLRSLLPAMLLISWALIGCGSAQEKPPTAQEAADFRGKTISPEQKARGMAAAMGGVGGAKAATKP